MRIAFRTDASKRIGTGHVMRCLALAEALQARGAQLTFVCRELDGHLGDAIRKAGHGCALLPRAAQLETAGNGTAHADWLEVSAETDAAQTRLELDRLGGVDWLVVDHYALDADWQRRQRPAARNILVIDDLADRPHDADALLDPLPAGAGRYAGRVPRRCRLLLGPGYALLREEFARARIGVQPRTALRRLFVSFGGVDAAGDSGRAIDALALLGSDAPDADVVAGGSNPQAGALRARCAALPRVRFHHAVGNVAELMAAADFALGAGGVMTWERASVGLPALVIPVAHNQEPGAAALEAAGGGITLAPALATPERIAQRLAELRAAPERLRAMSAQCLALTEGLGAARVAQLLCAPAIRLRRATAADSENVLRWRNDPKIRQNSFDTAEIGRADHERWLAGVLGNPDRLLLIAEHEGRPVGVLRYDIAGDTAMVSIYLAPGTGGHGYGPAVLCAGHALLVTERPAVRRVDARIKPDNRGSRRAFEEAGYRLDGTLFCHDLTP